MTMKNQSPITIHGFNGYVCYAEAKGMGIVWDAYANDCPTEDIMECGFNCNSGYVYIALENGISICSMLGRVAEYLVTDFEDGREHFFDTYEEAENHLQNANQQ